MKAKPSLIFWFLIFLIDSCYAQSNEYFCGFASADQTQVVHTIIHGSPDKDSSCAMMLGTITQNKSDSLVNSIYMMVEEALGGRPKSICLIRDDGAPSGYKYAAAGRKSFEDGSNVRTLSYRPAELTPQLMAVENGWALKAILFHEMGHHQNGDTFTLIDKQTAEEWADRFAGHWLSIFGAPLASVKAAFSKFTDSLGGNGYPPRSERILIVEDSWNKAKHPENSIVLSLARASSLLDNAFAGDTKESVTKLVEGNVKKNFLNKLTIINKLKELKLHTSGIFADNFLIDKSFLYFKNHEKLFAVGRVAPSDLPGYKLMIYDKYYNYIYIDEMGRLSIINLKFRDQQLGDLHMGDLLK